ncbi:MAG: TOBE domain-containing protein, partial [Methanomicrobiales archaeon]|nr:TOBE domain-containing protein [Methanomicrobiales archaeon]
VENILEGTVVGRNDGYAAVDLGGLILKAVTDAAVGEAVTLCIRAGDVIIGSGGGARNTAAGTVTAVVEDGPVAEVKVDCGVELVAVLPWRAVQDLSLAPGIAVALSIEAAAIHLIRG